MATTIINGNDCFKNDNDCLKWQRPFTKGKIALAPFPRDIKCKEVEGSVMVEGFPSFGTKAFVICCVTTEDSNTPSLAVELVQMCRCQYFTTGFATESSMTGQSKTRNDVHLLL